MGAISFHDIIYTREPLETAYREAIANAQHEYGHDTYNGTISTTDSLSISPLHNGNPIPENEIDYSQILDRIDHMEKRCCEALPIVYATPDKIETLGWVTVEITVPADTVKPQYTEDGIELTSRKAIDVAFEKEIKRRIRSDKHLVTNGNMFQDPTRLETPGKISDYRTQFHSYHIVQKPKATTRATSGKAETRYFIIHDNDNRIPDWKHGHPTQAAARKALPTQLPKYPKTPSTSYSIIALTRRDNGDPLVTHNLDAAAGKTVRIAATGMVQRILERGTPTNDPGWLFYGLAAY